MAGSGVVICTVLSTSSHCACDLAQERHSSLRRDSGAAIRALVPCFPPGPGKTQFPRSRRGATQWKFAAPRKDRDLLPAFPESGLPSSSAAGRSSVPLRPRNSVRSPVTEACLPPRSANAMRPPNSPPNTLLAKIAPVCGSSSVTMIRRRSAAGTAQHPFGIGGHGESTRAAGIISAE